MFRSIMLSVALTFSACTCEEKPQESLDNQIVTSRWSGKDERIDKLTKGLKELAAAVKQAKQVKTGPMVHWEALGQFIPKTLPEFERRGDRQGGFEQVGKSRVARARGRYTKGQQRLDIVITDTTRAPALRAGVMVSEGLDEKSEEHITRGVEVDGHPALVQWRSGTREAQVVALVANRYVVDLRLRPTDSPDPAVELTEQLELAELAKLEGPLADEKSDDGAEKQPAPETGTGDTSEGTTAEP